MVINRRAEGIVHAFESLSSLQCIEAGTPTYAEEGHTNKTMIVHFFDFEGTRLDFVDVFFAQATQD